jgi:hypothetical protein
LGGWLAGDPTQDRPDDESQTSQGEVARFDPALQADPFPPHRQSRLAMKHAIDEPMYQDGQCPDDRD